jgi:hypothetical protein
VRVLCRQGAEIWLGTSQTRTLRSTLTPVGKDPPPALNTSPMVVERECEWRGRNSSYKPRGAKRLPVGVTGGFSRFFVWMILNSLELQYYQVAQQRIL